MARKNAQTFAIKHGSLDGTVNMLNATVCLVGCFFSNDKAKLFDDRLLQEVTSMEMSKKKMQTKKVIFKCIIIHRVPWVQRESSVELCGTPLDPLI